MRARSPEPGRQSRTGTIPAQRSPGDLLSAALADPPSAGLAPTAPKAAEPLPARAADPRFAQPPTEEEKYLYLAGRQHRWIFVAHTIAFVGVGFSLVGFATMRYWTLIFLVPFFVYMAENLVGLRTSSYKRQVTLPDHQFKVEFWDPDRVPSVDVFLPSCGEDIDLLENTYLHVGRLDWPGRLRVLVLDDSARPDVARLAERHGFDYLARTDHAHKKAGNLQYGFERSDGDHVLILDADFVPRADLLRELVPYLDEEDVGIVQSPQYFSTDKQLNWLQRSAGATQELFYRMIQPSRDTVGAAICVGTSALYRRSALEQAGGFPLLSHSEDVYTGLRLADHDFRVQYVPVVVSKGVCPADLNSFISQQYRWCEGSMKLVAAREFHLDEKMTRRKRLCYWSGIIYYLSTAMNVFFSPLPALVMVFVLPQFVRPSNMIPLIGVVAMWLVVYPLVMKGRWRLEVLRAQAIYSFAHVVAIHDVFYGTVAEWVPSNGGVKVNPVAVRVRRIMGWYLLPTQALIVAGLFWQIDRSGPAQWWATAAFVALNLYIFVPVLLAAFGLSKVSAKRPAPQDDSVGAVPA